MRFWDKKIRPEARKFNEKMASYMNRRESLIKEVKFYNEMNYKQNLISPKKIKQ